MLINKLKRLTQLGFAIFAMVLACNSPISKSEPSTLPIDTTKAVKIGQFWIIPKVGFEFNAINQSHDTLSIVTCSEFVYSPFGAIKNKSAFGSSLLSKFQITPQMATVDIGKVELHFLKKGSNELIFFFDDDNEASTHSDILKGEIHDSTVQLFNGIQIGMKKDAFGDVFFDRIPKELLKTLNCVILESCVEGIKHIYSFKDNKLQSIHFNSNSYWNIKND